MNISLFGGAFDPPHVGHSQVAKYLITEKITQEVWFVPVYTHPWAKRLGKEILSPYEDRVTMLKLILGNKHKIAHFKGVSYTYDTLTYFSDKFPRHTFSWVMGSEYLGKFNDFLALHPKLLDFSFYIYPRESHPFEPLYPNMTALTKAPLVTASSTNIRQRVSQEKSIDSLVIKEVNEYINSHKLYRKNNPN